MKKTFQLVLMAFVGACTQSVPTHLCEPFYTALEAVPHVALSLKTGEFVSNWDGLRYRGCEVEFETNDSTSAGVGLPAFDALEGSEMYRLGWRMIREIGADGPGTSIFGVEKDSVACIVRWDQPAYIDDDGEFVQSQVLNIAVQCRPALD